MRITSICFSLFLLLGHSAQVNAALDKAYGFLPNGKLVSCKEAYAYRDKELVQEYDLLATDYASGKAARQKLVREELNKHLDTLLKDWDRKSPQLQKELAGEGVALVLAVASWGTGMWLQTYSGMTENNLHVAKHLVDRGATLIGVIEKAAINGKVAPFEIGLLPVNLVVPLIPVVGKPIEKWLPGLPIGIAVKDTWLAYAEYSLAKSEYEGEAKILRAALEKLALRSVESQLEGLNALKNQIDKTCN